MYASRDASQELLVQFVSNHGLKEDSIACLYLMQNVYD